MNHAFYSFQEGSLKNYNNTTSPPPKKKNFHNLISILFLGFDKTIPHEEYDADFPKLTTKFQTFSMEEEPRPNQPVY